MKSVTVLIDAICDVYDNAKYQPLPDGTTFCNYAAEDICHAFGYNGLDNKMADEIFAFMGTSPDWQEVLMPRVQDLANQGSLVFAVANGELLKQAHGHICVIRPGRLKDSGKWGQVPSIMNIGAENFIGRAKRGPLQGMSAGLNEAFVPMPKFYVLVSTL